MGGYGGYLFGWFGGCFEVLRAGVLGGVGCCFWVVGGFVWVWIWFWGLGGWLFRGLGDVVFELVGGVLFVVWGWCLFRLGDGILMVGEWFYEVPRPVLGGLLEGSKDLSWGRLGALKAPTKPQ